MDIRRLADDISVSGQIGTDDLSVIAAQGFKVVINNRPDGEMIGQPTGASIEAAAQAAGLEYHAIAISGPIDQAAIDAFGTVLASAAGPVLAYCRSGMRSSSVWALSQAGPREPEDLIAAAAIAGYDLSGLRPVLEARRGS